MRSKAPGETNCFATSHDSIIGQDCTGCAFDSCDGRVHDRYPYTTTIPVAPHPLLWKAELSLPRNVIEEPHFSSQLHDIKLSCFMILSDERFR